MKWRVGARGGELLTKKGNGSGNVVQNKLSPNGGQRGQVSLRRFPGNADGFGDFQRVGQRR